MTTERLIIPLIKETCEISQLTLSPKPMCIFTGAFCNSVIHFQPDDYRENAGQTKSKSARNDKLIIQGHMAKRVAPA